MTTALRAALLLAVLTPPPVHAQERPEGRALPATAEARLAWDYRSEAPGLGVALRLPLLGGRGDLLAGGDAVFRDGLTEVQAHVDALVVLGGRGAIVVGGGPVWLSSVFESGGEREGRWGYGAVAGVRQLPDPDQTVGFVLELRWVFVDELEPRFLELGVALPLFRSPF